MASAEGGPRTERLKRLLDELKDERERLDAILFRLEGEPQLSVPLARIDRRIAELQAETERTLDECLATE